jgi:hypothetical protein
MKIRLVCDDGAVFLSDEFEGVGDVGVITFRGRHFSFFDFRSATTGDFL